MNLRNATNMEDVGEDIADESLLWHQEELNDGDFPYDVEESEDIHVTSDLSHLHDGNVVVMVPTEDDAFPHAVQNTSPLTSPSLLDILASHLRHFLNALQRLKDVLHYSDPASFSEEYLSKEDCDNNNTSWSGEDAISTNEIIDENSSSCHPWSNAIQDRLKDLLHTLTALFEATTASGSIHHDNQLPGSIPPLLNVSSTLQAAQTLVSSTIPDPSNDSQDAVKAGASNLYQAAENIALALSSSISQYLMAECLAGTRSSFCQSPTEMAGYSNYHSNYHSNHLQTGTGRKDDSHSRTKSVEDLTLLVTQAVHQDHTNGENQVPDEFHGYDIPTGEEVDEILANLKNGVKFGLDRAKRWSKYCRDVLVYIEKRATLELDYGKRLLNLASSAKASIAEIGGDDSESGRLGGTDPFLPFKDVYSNAFHHDIDHGQTLQATANLLQTYKFIEPLTHRRLTHDRMRKDIKEAWSRELKRMSDADANLRKARSSYVSRQQEYDRAKERGKEGLDNIGPEKAEKRKKAEEEAMFKAVESENNYKQCVFEANRRQEELIKVKHEVLLKLRELMLQCDQTMKAVTVTYFQLMHTVRDPVPQQLHMLAEASRSYVPGHQYKAFVVQKAASAKPVMEENLKPYFFIPYSATGSVISGPVNLDYNSAKRPGSGQTNENEYLNRSPVLAGSHHVDIAHPHGYRPSAGPLASWPGTTNSGSPPAFKGFTGRSPGNSLSGSPRDAPGHLTGSGTHDVLDTEGSASVSGGSTRSLDQGIHTQTTPLTLRRGAAIVNTRTKRSGNDGRLDGGNGAVGDLQSSGNRHRGSSSGLSMSDNAKSHAFHRLRTPSKCRDCDRHLFLQGVECERCGLAAHKKCLTSKRLPACAGQKGQLQRRLTTFGVDISFHVTLSASLIPPIVRRCIAEIDRRGLSTRGIYRVSAVKSKVEELCHQFERDQEGTVLKDYPPQVVANTLKLYFRQLPEPLLTHRLHHEFIRVSREDLQLRDEDKAVKELADIVDRLPSANFTTAKILMHHLRRVTENSSANQMPASNLGIVFGPTLLKPSEDMASLSILMDTPHQARVVELLIVHVDEIFGPEELIPGQGDGGQIKPPIRSDSNGRVRKRHIIPRGSDASDSSDADTDDEDEEDDDYDEAEDYDDDDEDGCISPRIHTRSRVTSGGSNDFTAEVLAAGQRVVNDDEDGNQTTSDGNKIAVDGNKTTMDEKTVADGNKTTAETRYPTPPAIPAHGKVPENVKEESPTLLSLSQSSSQTLNLQQLPLQRVAPQLKTSPSPPPAISKSTSSEVKSSTKIAAIDEKNDLLPPSISSESVTSQSTPTRGDSPSSQCSLGGKTSLSPLDQSMALLSQPPNPSKHPSSLARQRSVSPIRSQDRFPSPAIPRLPQQIEDKDETTNFLPSGHNVQYQAKMNQGIFKSSLGSPLTGPSSLSSFSTIEPVPPRILAPTSGQSVEVAPHPRTQNFLSRKAASDLTPSTIRDLAPSPERPTSETGELNVHSSSAAPSPTIDREPRFV